MSEFFLIFLFGPFGLLYIFYRYIYKRRQIKNNALDIFEKIIQKYPDCSIYYGNSYNYPCLKGSINNINFYCQIRCKPGKYQDSFYFDIKSNHSTFNNISFSISSEHGLSSVREALGIEDIHTGDDKFDREMKIKGKMSPDIIAMLDYQLRKNIYLMKINSHAMTLNQKNFFITYDYETVNTYVNIDHLLNKTIIISKMITKGKSTRGKLIDNIQIEKNDGALLKQVQILTDYQEFNETEKTVIEKLLKHRNISIQVEAAQKLGEMGMKHILDILQKNKTNDDNIIIRIIYLLAKYDYINSIPQFRETFVKTKSPEVRIEILRAFRLFKDIKLSSFLVGYLHKLDGDVLSQLVEALETCGKKEAVEPLYKLSKGSLNPFLKNKVQQTIAAIQARLGDVDKGWLSVAELSEKEGGLSLSKEADRGALSKPEEE